MSDIEIVHPFAIVPEELLHDPAVSDAAVRLYGVLLRHGSNPDNCFPSHARLARIMGRAAGSVPKWVAELEAAGWVQRVPRWQRAAEDGAGRQIAYELPADPAGWSPASNGYRVFSVRSATGTHPDAREGGVPSTQQGASPAENAPNDSHVNESHKEREELSLVLDDAQPSAPDWFERFWTEYPRKVGKGQARKAWASAKKKQPPELLAQAAALYALQVRREQTETKFIPHPATWLNGERWQDVASRPTVDQDRDARTGRIEL